MGSRPPGPRLRPAMELVNKIGELAFDLQHHRDDEIAQALAFMRECGNGPMFAWLVGKLSETAEEQEELTR